MVRVRRCVLCTTFVPGVSLYKFPQDHAIAAQWATFCGISHESIKPTTRLCAVHFTADCFKRTFNKHATRPVQLKIGVIPTLNRDGPPAEMNLGQLRANVSASEGNAANDIVAERRHAEVADPLRVRLGRRFCCICGSIDISHIVLHFYRLPRDAGRRRDWLKSLELVESEVKDWFRVCSRHFVDGNPAGVPVRSLVNGLHTEVGAIHNYSSLVPDNGKCFVSEMSDESGNEVAVNDEMPDSLVVGYPMADIIPKEEAVTDIESETGSDDMVGTPGTDRSMEEELVAYVELDDEEYFGLDDTENDMCSNRVTAMEDDVIGRPECPGRSGESPRRRKRVVDELCAEAHEETGDFSCTEQTGSDNARTTSTPPEVSTVSRVKSSDYSYDGTKAAKKPAPNQLGDKPLSCDFCDYRSNNSGHLKSHIRIHTGEKPFVCKVCGHKSRTENNMKIHMRVHTKEKPYVCEFCNFKFSIVGNLKKHLRAHTGDRPHACELCDYKSTNAGDLKVHMMTHTGEKPYACKLCDYKTRYSGHLANHMKTHTGEKPYACELCSFRCIHAGNLKVHMRTHTGEKPYACSLCDYRCNLGAHLKRHLMTHTGEKPFACDICNYRCSSSGNLKSHIQTHTDEKPYSCALCEFRCHRASDLKSHMNTHTGERPYACDLCDFRCSKGGNLSTHKRIHTGEKRFDCDTCNYKCSRSGDMKVHKMTHTGEKPYACDMCDYRCSTASYLKRHKKIHTSDPA